MRTGYSLLTATILLAAGIVWAQNESDYQEWMKSNAISMGSMSRNITAKNAEGAAADARQLESNFKQVVDFWKTRGGAEDAVNFARRAQIFAGDVAKDVAAGDFRQAADDLKSMQTNCAGCHMAHREGSQGAFKIK